MGNAAAKYPFAPVDEPNPKHRVWSREELPSTPEALAVDLRAAAEAILETPLPDVASMPMCGTDAGPFGLSLLVPVPHNHLKRSNVWYVSEFDRVEFHPWVYRIGYSLKTANMFERFYNRVNTDHRFPKEQFSEAVRRAKNCAYQRKRRLIQKKSGLRNEEQSC